MVDNGKDLRKELEKRYIELQILKQQLNVFLEEKNALNEHVAELTITISSIKKLKGVKDENEIWSPLGSGAFVKSDIKDTNNILVAVGSGVVASKTKVEATETLKKRLEELTQIDKEIIKNINIYSETMQKKEKEMQQVVEKLEKLEKK